MTMLPVEKPKNANFELAEAKATKAIQKHSMNIGGQEKNYQIDEAYLLLGNSRYYDQRFIPALDAFNYILYKYPHQRQDLSSRRFGEKKPTCVWVTMPKSSKTSASFWTKKSSKTEVVADANALLSQSFLNLEEKDSAIAKLKVAEKFTKINSERA